MRKAILVANLLIVVASLLIILGASRAIYSNHVRARSALFETQYTTQRLNTFEIAVSCSNGGDPTTRPELLNGALVVSCGNDVNQ